MHTVVSSTFIMPNSFYFCNTVHFNFTDANKSPSAQCLIFSSESGAAAFACIVHGFSLSSSHFTIMTATSKGANDRGSI